MFPLKRSLLVASLAASTCFSTRAFAQTVEACIASHAQGQALSNKGELLAAVEKFQSCAAEACPEEIRSECGSSMLAAKAIVPSIVIAVRRGDSDILDALVSIDGSGNPRRLDGRPIELDPGPHVVKIHNTGTGDLERQLVLRQGERNRLVSIELPGPPPSPRRARDVRPTLPPPSTPSRPEALPVALIPLGIGLVSAGSFVGFAIAGKSKEGDLDACRPNCDKEDVRMMRQSYLIADLSLGITLLSFSTAVWLWWPTSEPGAAGKVTTAIQFDPDGRIGVSALGQF